MLHPGTGSQLTYEVRVVELRCLAYDVFCVCAGMLHEEFEQNLEVAELSKEYDPDDDNEDTRTFASSYEKIQMDHARVVTAYEIEEISVHIVLGDDSNPETLDHAARGQAHKRAGRRREVHLKLTGLVFEKYINTAITHVYACTTLTKNPYSLCIRLMLHSCVNALAQYLG
jgi:hypothetical protein